MFEDAIKIILAKCSKETGTNAMETLRLFRANSPTTQIRYSNLLQLAYSEPDVVFSSDEKQILADALDALIPEEIKSTVLTIRITASEKSTLAIKAESKGLTLSEYARRKLLDLDKE